MAELRSYLFDMNVTTYLEMSSDIQQAKETPSIQSQAATNSDIVSCDNSQSLELSKQNGLKIANGTVLVASGGDQISETVEEIKNHLTFELESLADFDQTSTCVRFESRASTFNNFNDSGGLKYSEYSTAATELNDDTTLRHEEESEVLHGLREAFRNYYYQTVDFESYQQNVTSAILDVRIRSHGQTLHHQCDILRLLTIAPVRFKTMLFGMPGFGKKTMFKALAIRWASTVGQIARTRYHPDKKGFHETKSEALALADRLVLYILYSLNNRDVSNLGETIMCHCEQRYREWRDTEGVSTKHDIRRTLQELLPKTIILLSGYEKLDYHGRIQLKKELGSGILSHANVIVSSRPVHYDIDLGDVFTCFVNVKELEPDSDFWNPAEDNLFKKEIEGFKTSTNLVALKGCSPLFARLIENVYFSLTVVNSLFDLLKCVLGEIVFRKLGLPVEQHFQRLGEFLLDYLKRGSYCFTKLRLERRFGQLAERIIQLEVFHESEMENETVLTVAHPAFIQFFCVYHLRSKWNELQTDNERQAFLEQSLSADGCSLEFIIDSHNPTISYFVGVLPDIVLEVNGLNGLSCSIFKLRSDLKSKDVDSAFKPSHLLTRVADHGLPMFDIVKKELNDYLQEQFGCIFELLDFPSCNVNVRVFRDGKTGKYYLRFRVYNEADDEVMIGVASLGNASEVEHNPLMLYDELYFEFTCSDLDETYPLLKKVFQSYSKSCLPAERSELLPSELLYLLVTSALEYSETDSRYYTLVSLGSYSIVKPELITWEIVKEPDRPPVVSYIGTKQKTYGVKEQLVDDIKQQKYRILNIINHFAGSAETLSVCIKSNFSLK